jgi:hypothetical protein
MDLSDKAIALIRTWLPVWVGSAIALGLAHFPGVGAVLDNVSADWKTAAAAGVTALVISGWYWLTQFIQHRWPAFGKYLTGSSKVPAYQAVPVSVKSSETVRRSGAL